MNQKQHVIFLCALLLICIALFTYLIIPKDLLKFKPIYSDNPKKWIDTKGPVKEINIEKATAGAGEIDELGLQYENKENDVTIAFTYSGFYKGNFFTGEFTDENGNALIKITNDMKPNDGIVEGFVIEKIKDGKPIAYIFLDEDWKQIIGKTYIRYGAHFEHVRIFRYEEASKGIYVDSFEDDKTRFDEDFTMRSGGISVGDVTDEKVANRNPDITTIIFR